VAGEAYAAISASFPWHRKVVALPEADRIAAFGFYVAACVYCQAYRTDGYLSYPQLVAIFPFPEEQRNRLGSLLIDASLFDRAEGGVQIHHYLDHNRSRAEIDAGTKAMSDGGRRGGQVKRRDKTSLPLKPTLEGSPEKSSAESAVREEDLGDYRPGDNDPMPRCGDDT